MENEIITFQKVLFLQTRYIFTERVVLQKNTWKELISFQNIKSYPDLPCPYCGSDKLTLDQNSIQYRPLSGIALKDYIQKFSYMGEKNLKKQQVSNESAWIKLLRTFVAVSDEVAYKPHQFVAFFQCSLCSESVTSAGLAKLPTKNDSTSPQIKVENFNPPVPMFELNSVTPKSINDELLLSFNYFHSDTSSSGSKLRRAIEKLCIELGYTEKNLHRNIEELSSVHPRI